MSKKNNIVFTKPGEPSFLKKMKEEIGYKEGPTIESKKQTDNLVDDEREDKYDEKPTVVVLSAGDLTAEEAAVEEKNLETNNKSIEDGGRLMFKKPEKEKEKDKDMLKTTTKKQESNVTKKVEETRNKRKGKEEMKKAKQSKRETKTNLLSFDEDDEIG